MDSPITYPTVELQGETFPIRFTWADIRRLKQRGIDVYELNKTVSAFELHDRNMEILAAGLSHTGKDFTADSLAGMIDFNDLGKVTVAVTEALVKAAAQLNQAIVEAVKAGRLPQNETAKSEAAKAETQTAKSSKAN